MIPASLTTPEALLSGGAVAWLLTNKELTNKLLGPSADYIGDLSKRFLEHALEKQPRNIANIFIKATKKLGNKVDEPGAIEPRILKTIIEDGAFIEEDLVADYYAGVLASSRDKDGKNDNGLPYLKLLQSMSSFDLILHSLLYKTVQGEFKESAYRIGNPNERHKMELFVPYEQLVIELMKYSPNTNTTNAYSKIADTMFRFSQHSIILERWELAPAKSIKTTTKGKVSTSGLIFTPAPVGTCLALWGYGNGDLDKDYFFCCELNDDLNISPVSNVSKLSD